MKLTLPENTVFIYQEFDENNLEFKNISCVTTKPMEVEYLVPVPYNMKDKKTVQFLGNVVEIFHLKFFDSPLFESFYLMSAVYEGMYLYVPVLSLDRLTVTTWTEKDYIRIMKDT